MNYSGNISNWRLHVLKLQSLKNSWVGEGGGGQQFSCNVTDGNSYNSGDACQAAIELHCQIKKEIGII